MVAVVLIQLHRFGVYFRSPSHLFDDSPLYHVDYSVLAYQMEAARLFAAKTGQLWGYDPFFLDGFTLSFLWNSNVLLQVLAWLLPWASTDGILKGFLAGLLLVEPFVLYAAFRHFGVTREAGLWSTALATTYLAIAHPVVLLTLGVLTGYAVFPLFLYCAGLMLRVATTEVSGRLRVQLAVALALALLTHKTFVVLIVPVAVVVTLHLLHTRDRSRIATLFAGLIVMLAINAFWLLPAWSQRDAIDFSFNAFLREPDRILFVDRLLLQGDLAAHGMGSYLLTGALVLAAAGGLAAMWRPYRFACLTVSATLAWLLVLIFAGHHVPGNLHGVRYFYSLGLWLAVPSAFLLARLFAAPGSSRSTTQVAVTALALTCWMLPNYQRHMDAQIERGAAVYSTRVPLFSYEPDRRQKQAEDLYAWLEENAQGDGTIFVQQVVNEYFHGPLGLGTGLRFISAPYNYVFLRENFINRYFQDLIHGDDRGPLEWGGAARFDPGPGSFEKYARLYNVRWWAVREPGGGFDVSEFYGMERVAEVGEWVVYRYDVPMSDFLLGSGRIEYDYGRIVIRDVKPASGHIVLKLHWTDRVRVTGAASIAPHDHPGLPLPFTRIAAPEETVILEFQAGGHRAEENLPVAPRKR